MSHCVSACLLEEMLMRSTVDIVSNSELAGFISKPTLTRFKEMFDQVLCKNASDRTLVTALVNPLLILV